MDGWEWLIIASIIDALIYLLLRGTGHLKGNTKCSKEAKRIADEYRMQNIPRPLRIALITGIIGLLLFLLMMWLLWFLTERSSLP